MRLNTLCGLLALLPAAATAQSVGIGTTTPDAKSALDIRATDKGLLIPRLTAAQRTGIASPPQGLMVYQTDGSASGGAQTGFWYYAGTGGWVFLDAGAGGSGLTLPYSGSYGGSAATSAFDVSHTNGGVAVRGAAPNSGVGVYGASSTGSGVYGTASGSGGYGVRGAATAANSAGLYGTATGTNTYGVIGDAQTGVQGQGGSGAGLSGLSSSGPALLAAKTSGQTGRAAELTLAGTGNDSTALYVSTAGARPALRAVNTATSAQAAIRGVKQAAAANGAGVEGVVTTGASGNAAGVRGLDRSGGTTTAGVLGTATAGYGVSGSSTSGVGVYGTASNSSITSGAVVGDNTNAGTAAVGVLGLTKSGYGVRGAASATGGYGVAGEATDSYGVYGTSQTGVAVYGSSSNGSSASTSYGVQGASQDSAAVYGSNDVNSPRVGAVQGVARAGGGSVGVLGITSSGYGVRGLAGNGGWGVNGVATTSYGVRGTSTSGVGTYGISTSSYGVQGQSTSSSGVYGSTGASTGSGAAGVQGYSNSTGYGVLGQSAGGNGTGVRGEGTGNVSVGVYGQSSGSSTGANAGVGVQAVGLNGANALSARATGTGSAAVLQLANTASTADAVQMINSGLGRAAFVNQSYALSAGNALEVQNAGTGATALFNQSNSGSSAAGITVTQAGTGPSLSLAGGGPSSYFNPAGQLDFNTTSGTRYATIRSGVLYYLGASLVFDVLNNASPATASPRILMSSGGLNELYDNWLVGNNLNVTGTLSKGGGSFKIDHPLDPENQYLYHSFVESPDMLNVYNGNVVLDAQGEATVTLPDYFEALNRDFRYQLTPIGAAFTPYVKAKVAGNQFRIAGQPGAEVSWQVTGIRQDKWANQHRIPNAVPKEAENRGKYLHPEAFGQPAARGIGYRATEAARPKEPAPAPTATR